MVSGRLHNLFSKMTNDETVVVEAIEETACLMIHVLQESTGVGSNIICLESHISVRADMSIIRDCCFPNA
jgi:hypothetical protein